MTVLILKWKYFTFWTFHNFQNWFQVKDSRWSAVSTWAPRFGPFLNSIPSYTDLLLPGRGHSLHGDCSDSLGSQQQSAAVLWPHAADHCSAAEWAAEPPGDRQDPGPGQRQLLLPALLRHTGLGHGAHCHRSESPGRGKHHQYKCNNSVTVWVMFCNLSPCQLRKVCM